MSVRQTIMKNMFISSPVQTTIFTTKIIFHLKIRMKFLLLRQNNHFYLKIKGLLKRCQAWGNHMIWLDWNHNQTKNKNLLKTHKTIFLLERRMVFLVMDGKIKMMQKIIRKILWIQQWVPLTKHSAVQLNNLFRSRAKGSQLSQVKLILVEIIVLQVLFCLNCQDPSNTNSNTMLIICLEVTISSIRIKKSLGELVDQLVLHQ